MSALLSLFFERTVYKYHNDIKMERERQQSNDNGAEVCCPARRTTWLGSDVVDVLK